MTTNDHNCIMAKPQKGTNQGANGYETRLKTQKVSKISLTLFFLK